MKLFQAHVVNFGSYSEQVFDFENQGLTLIHGDTGSGKSTMQDVAMWCLFGLTAKNGSVDDVRRWGNTEATRGILHFEHKGVIGTVVRVRGAPNENDLMWYTYKDATTSEECRGKDISETQQLFNKFLGISPELYNIAAYYNEYSPTRTFFEANAKQRRELFEMLCDMSFPSAVAENASVARKISKKEYTVESELYHRTLGKKEQVTKSKISNENDSTVWVNNQIKKLKEFTVKNETFEIQKLSKIEALQTKFDLFETTRLVELSKIDLSDIDFEKCPTCNEPNKDVQKKILKRRELQTKTNPYITELELAKNDVNQYTDKIKDIISQENPYIKSIQRDENVLFSVQNDLTASEDKIAALSHRVNSLSRLITLTATLRSQLLAKVISEVQGETNRYLESYFDTELRVQLVLGDSDSLEIFIWKSGHECNYKQLSKGQKGLLKLCFAVATMHAAANNAGIHFSTLCFDEALDGLDENLKIKAYALFSELELKHETVLIIEHNSTLQSLFSRSCHVKLEGDESTISYS